MPAGANLPFALSGLFIYLFSPFPGVLQSSDAVLFAHLFEIKNLSILRRQPLWGDVFFSKFNFLLLSLKALGS